MVHTRVQVSYGCMKEISESGTYVVIHKMGQSTLFHPRHQYPLTFFHPLGTSLRSESYHFSLFFFSQFRPAVIEMTALDGVDRDCL
jgi:hypothetical protein